MSPQYSIFSLPPEVIDLIFGRLGIDSFESLRLVSRQACKLATPFVFREFLLYPHSESFQQLRRIVEAPHLRCYVQSLEYDCQWSEFVKHKIQNIASRQQLSEWEETFSERIIPPAALIPCTLEDLPNLSALSVTDPFASVWMAQDIATTPAFYRKRIPNVYYYESLYDLKENGCEIGSYNYHSYAIPLMMYLNQKSGTCRLRSLTLSSVNLDALLQCKELDFTKLESCLQHLETLKIHDQTDTNSPKRPYWPSLHSMLKAATNLTSLSLTLRSSQAMENYGSRVRIGEEHLQATSVFRTKSRDDFEVPTRLVWSAKLRSLHLAGLSCTEREIETVLSDCSSTLRSLKLNGIVLVPEKKHDPRPCFVRFFKWLQRNLRLERVKFADFFRNTGLQDWLFLRNPWPESLSAQVHDFVLYGGVCPIDFLAVPSGFYDLQSPVYTRQPPSSLGRHPYLSDLSGLKCYYFTVRLYSELSPIESDDEDYFEDYDAYSRHLESDEGLYFTRPGQASRSDY